MRHPQRSTNCSLEHRIVLVAVAPAFHRFYKRSGGSCRDFQSCFKPPSVKMQLLWVLSTWLLSSFATTCPLNSNVTPSEIKFGYLVHVDYPQVLGAVSLAVERINNDLTILPNTTLSFKYASLTGQRYEAIKVMTRLRDENISAFIGPDESCRHEAMIASAWNLPMVAYVRYFDASSHSKI